MSECGERLEDFDFALPEDRIARFPLHCRSASALMHVNPNQSMIHHSVMREFPSRLHPNDLLVFNDTRVMLAKLSGHKASGGRVEVLVERVIDSHQAWAMVRASHAPQPGSIVFLGKDQDFPARVQAVKNGLVLLALETAVDSDWQLLMQSCGQLPLPPYLKRQAQEQDQQRYQTIFARNLGSAAAPTAGLHFDPTLLAALDQAGYLRAELTLHVGAGTFQPVRVNDLTQHTMHCECFGISEITAQQVNTAKTQGRRIVAIGTTTLRALESAAVKTGKVEAGSDQTRLFIRPGYSFKVVDALLTNFHLPKSTLLMLVCAFAGHENILKAYQKAIELNYRFFSYGDGMLLEKKSSG